MSNLYYQIQAKIAEVLWSDGRKLTDFISNIIIKDNNVGFSIDVTESSVEEGNKIKAEVERKLQEIPHIEKITIVLTSNKSNASASTARVSKQHFIEGVNKIILVAAGKGGVGKSTITSIIAEELNSKGYKVGIVDADIYGPSIPQIFGVNEVPKIVDKKMVPLRSRGIEIISISFLTKGDVVAWRGPMASKVIYQLLSLTSWNNLDYLIIDMPPGTGDIHLSIIENYIINGVVMVTTPQKMAEIDVRKAIDLYKKFDLHILGIIENMSYLMDITGGKVNIFTGNSGTDLAKLYNIPLLAQIPIIPALSEHCDQGKSLIKLADFSIKDLIVKLEEISS